MQTYWSFFFFYHSTMISITAVTPSLTPWSYCSFELNTGHTEIMAVALAILDFSALLFYLQFIDAGTNAVLYILEFLIDTFFWDYLSIRSTVTPDFSQSQILKLVDAAIRVTAYGFLSNTFHCTA